MTYYNMDWGDKGGDLFFLALLVAPTFVLAGSALQLIQAGAAVANPLAWMAGLVAYFLGLSHVLMRTGVRF